MTHEHVTDEGMIVEEEYDYYAERPNDLRPLSDMEDWQIVEGEPDVRGWPVVNQNGDNLGKIDDLMISEEAGAAIMALVGIGGYLGVGEKQTIIPIDWMELNLDRDQAMFLGSDDDLRGAPEYTADTRDFGEFYSFWEDREPEWTGEEGEMTATDLKGWRVIDEHGHEIGEIDDFVSDDRGALAVIGYGRFWDKPTVHTLVPVESLAADEENRCVVLDMRADQLLDAPEYSGRAEDYDPWYDYWEGRREAA